jgi:hypothetical protein
VRGPVYNPKKYMTAAPTTTATSSSWLDSVLNTGLGLFSADSTADAAKTKATLDAKTAQANALAAQSNSRTTTILIIGAALVGVVVLVLVLRRR